MPAAAESAATEWFARRGRLAAIGMQPAPLALRPRPIAPAAVTVARAAAEGIRRMSRQAAPREGCAFLVGDASRVAVALPSRNLHPEPATHYAVDPALFLALEAELEGTGRRIVGVAHSHPSTDAVPSATDRAHALPGWLYLIHGCPPGRPGGVLRAWRLEGDPPAFAELPCHIEGPPW